MSRPFRDTPGFAGVDWPRGWLNVKSLLMSLTSREGVGGGSIELVGEVRLLRVALGPVSFLLAVTGLAVLLRPFIRWVKLGFGTEVVSTLSIGSSALSGTSFDGTV